MSKIGRKPILIEEWVEISINGNEVKVKWPKGELTRIVNEWVTVKQEDNHIVLSISDDNNKAFWGLNRSLIANMVEWVKNGYEKKLLIIWVWYWAVLQWKTLVLSLGLSHKVNFEIPDDIELSVEQDPKGNSIVTIKWINKHTVGQTAAKIREFRKPEPYKGKGIRYIDEYVKIKPGKAAGK